MARSPRPLIRALIAVGTAVALSTGVVQSVAHVGSPADAAAPAGCYTANGVSGYVTDEHGAPLAGAPVLLVSQKAPAGLKVGQRVHSLRLGFTKTDASGCYAIPLHASAALLAAADDYGAVNMLLTVQAGSSIEMINIPRVLQLRGTTVAMHAPGAASSTKFLPTAVRGRVSSTAAVVGAVHQSFGPQADAVRAAAARTVTATPTMRVGGMIARQTDSSVGGVPQVMTAPAGMTVSPDDDEPEVLVKVYAKHPVLVGQWWSQMKGVTENWRYSQGSTTELQSAVTAGAGFATYSKGLTYATTTNATVGWPTVHGKNGTFYRTYFRYAKYAVGYCDGTIGCQIWEYLIKPYSWERGTAMQQHIPYPSVNLANCVRYIRGSWEGSAGTRAVTWTNGVAIAGDLRKALGGSLSLSSQTGFTQQAQNVVHFNRRGRLCGTMGPLSQQPGALLAHPW